MTEFITSKPALQETLEEILEVYETGQILGSTKEMKSAGHSKNEDKCKVYFSCI